MSTLRDDLVALELRYWNAIKERDAATATSLTDDPCIVVGAQGVGEVDRQTLAGMLEGAKWELRDFAMDDVHIREVGDGVYAVAYKVSEDLTVDGEKVKLQAYDSSVWARRDGKWVCVVHTESIAGDPFGRH